MSQLLLKALRPIGRSLAPRAIARGLHINPAIPLVRSLQLQQPVVATRRLYQQVAQTDGSIGDDYSLFAPADTAPIALGDLQDDRSTKHYMQTGKSLAEQLSLMQACMVNGDIDRAQRMLVGLYKLYPEAMRDVADVSMHNEILAGMLSAKPRSLTTEALLWYDQMERNYSIKPNANTYAILIREFLRKDLRNVGTVLMQEMIRSEITFDSMLHSSYLSDSDIDMIKAVAQELMSENNENKDIATDLIRAVNAANGAADSVNAQYINTANASSADGGDVGDVQSTKEQAAHDSMALKSSKVSGIVHLQTTLKSLYTNELEGYNLQMRLERDTYDSEIARCKQVNESRGDPLLSSNIGALKRLTAKWLPRLEALIEEEQARCRQAYETASVDRARISYGRFFTQLDPPKIAIITILETLRMNAMEQKSHNSENMPKFVGVKTITLVSNLSTAIHNEIRFQNIKQRTNRHILARNMSVAKLASSGKLFNMAIRRAKSLELKANERDWLDTWDVSTKTRIGSLLVSMLIEVARVTEKISDPVSGVISERMAPAFTHDYLVYRGRKYGIIVPHSTLREMFKEDSIASTVSARSLPMLIPPRPWLTYNSGGYLSQDEPCMRMKESNEQLRYLKKASEENRLHTLLAGLDSLGLTRWAINRPVFEAVRKVWNSGIGLAEIPPSTYTVPEPVKPENYETDQKAKTKYIYEMREWQNGSSNQHSRRCDCNYKVEIAQAFLNHPMYFPHNMDFRGRAYPIPPHFNHLGNDLCRGLLLFDEGRPLTERGLFWLKIHLANLYGNDKLSHEDRIKFIDDSLDRIMESADNPIPDSILQEKHEGKLPWWLESSSPWQTLAACIEYTAAMRSPNPAEYVSRLHVHQDGTCNGLQHYAAMGRDCKGAFEVNLAPSEKPQDVYQGILNVVDRLINEDAEKGVKAALVLKGKLTRKIVKQTVMTNVYGVTLIGAREQISARLREVKAEDGSHEFNLVEVSSLSLYVAKKIFDSLGEMFTQAQEIQNWLNESASRIARSMPAQALAAWKRMILDSKTSQQKLRDAIKDAKNNECDLDSEKVMELRPDLGPGAMRRRRLNTLATKPMTTVAWTTPLGLTVVQPYRKYTMRNINTALQQITVRDANMPSPVNSQKQKTAFPPNFVHSLDASHMILSAIECKRAGLIFASVHDSYWTHACDIDKMNDILRDQFVKLHERPIMEDLKAEFEERYFNHMMPTPQQEYVVKIPSSVECSPKKAAKAAKLSKEEQRLQQEHRVEEELGQQHLMTCGETDVAIDKDGSESTVSSASSADRARAESLAKIEEVDLSSVELIDPKQDIVAALQQADQIEFTLTAIKDRMAKEIQSLESESSARIKEIRSKIRPPRKSTKTIAKAKSEPLASDSTETKLTVREYQKQIADIKDQLKKDRAAVERKYSVSFTPPSIFVSQPPSSDIYKTIDAMIKDGRLQGRLVKRIRWIPIEFDPLPKHGEFDLNEVRQSPYFFS
ncbi:DNA-directed RNA polymerase [Coemansia interrupta]|uniref:DNA-directed RNA polymerase n=1 Tax=Coemansia interrupta TaxID=1126814 RepID=A0A9W8HNU6_9FUNG|nr:DNA-directed RNA polymerase [Coemansia interrupta]